MEGSEEVGHSRVWVAVWLANCDGSSIFHLFDFGRPQKTLRRPGTIPPGMKPVRFKPGFFRGLFMLRTSLNDVHTMDRLPLAQQTGTTAGYWCKAGLLMGWRE
jgi:hypothetical protein